MWIEIKNKVKEYVGAFVALIIIGYLEIKQYIRNKVWSK